MQRALLLHSGGFTSRQWRKLSETLAPDFDVVAPDLLGYGESGPWPDGVPFHFRQDLDYVESLLGDGDDRVHLVGHSYGGFLALQLALRRPERVQAIAVYDPVAFGILDPVEDADAWNQLRLVKQTWDRDESGVDEAWLRAFIDWWNGAGAWDRLGEETRRAFRTMGWKVFQEVMSLAADRTDGATYATIAAPHSHPRRRDFAARRTPRRGEARRCAPECNRATDSGSRSHGTDLARGTRQ